MMEHYNRDVSLGESFLNDFYAATLEAFKYIFGTLPENHLGIGETLLTKESLSERSSKNSRISTWFAVLLSFFVFIVIVL